MFMIFLKNISLLDKLIISNCISFFKEKLKPQYQGIEEW